MLMEALADDVNEVALDMVVVVVDDDSFDKKVLTYLEHDQEEVNVHLNKSI
jgi:hypothetical protein